MKISSFTKFKNLDTKAPSDITKEEAIEKCNELYKQIAKFQNQLFVKPTLSVLIIFQGMDASGKDGAIKKITTPLNPRGIDVTSFKVPTTEELSHDFLWRIHQKTPAKGRIAFFNRSHYEDILITKVHNRISEKTYKERIDHINNFEKLLIENDTIIIKFFLDVSKDEQRERLDERINTPSKNWKYDPNDEIERKLWKEYSEAYETIFDKCNTKESPWYSVPADNKWYRDLIVAEIVYQTLKNLEL